eukprot:scaffold15065_cov140-Isochrysis_galbana.AAC.4
MEILRRRTIRTGRGGARLRSISNSLDFPQKGTSTDIGKPSTRRDQRLRKKVRQNDGAPCEAVVQDATGARRTRAYARSGPARCHRPRSPLNATAPMCPEQVQQLLANKPTTTDWLDPEWWITWNWIRCACAAGGRVARRRGRRSVSRERWSVAEPGVDFIPPRSSCRWHPS